MKKKARCGKMWRDAAKCDSGVAQWNWVILEIWGRVDGSGERLMLMKTEVGTLVSKIPYSQTPSCNERGKLWCDVPANLGALRGPTLTI